MRRAAVRGLLALLLCACAGAASAASPESAPLTLGWVLPTGPQVGWKHLSVAAGSVLWYPPSFRRVSGASGSVTVAVGDGKGDYLASVSATPQPYTANMTSAGEQDRIGWPSARLARVRTVATSVHEDARSLGGVFKGGIGACVMDDYVSRTKSIPYREIACLVQGLSDSVVIASTQVSAWARYGLDLEHVVTAYQATQ
jgi:hypothetical protein